MGAKARAGRSDRAGGGRAGPDARRERALAEAGVWPVAGVDEAGRGPIAGPVCAAAVILDLARIPAGLDDSKRLAASRREALFEAILSSAEAAAIAFATPSEIDCLNIRMATHLAMRRAVRALTLRPARLLVDGNDLPTGLDCGAEAIVGGDASSASISAASILAKVARDQLMHRADAHHPAYGFLRHVGYPSRAHLAALAELGPCELHRRSFGRVARQGAAAGLSLKNTGAGDQP